MTPKIEPHLTTDQLALRWQITPSAVEKRRRRKTGPPFLKLGNRVRYRVKDIERYERENGHNLPKGKRQ